jgi:hypothetical protein
VTAAGGDTTSAISSARLHRAREELWQVLTQSTRPSASRPSVWVAARDHREADYRRAKSLLLNEPKLFNGWISRRKIRPGNITADDATAAIDSAGAKALRAGAALEQLAQNAFLLAAVAMAAAAFAMWISKHTQR